MHKWEYKLIDSRNLSKITLLKGRSVDKAEDYLNALGDEGWEIINLVYDGLQHDTATFVGIAKRKKSA